MHDVLRQRLLRRIESLPEEQVYQVLDYIEFLESKYARDLKSEATGLQRFAEGLEDKLRRRAVSPATLREAFQLISSADRILSGVAKTGREILGDLAEPPTREVDRPRGGATSETTGGGARRSPREGVDPRRTRGEDAEPRHRTDPTREPDPDTSGA